MAAFHGVWSLAGFSGALLGLLMMNYKVPTTTHFLLVAALVGLVALVVQPSLIDSVRRDKPKEKARLPWQVDSGLVPLGLIGFCSLATEGAMFDWSGVYFREVMQVRSSLEPGVALASVASVSYLGFLLGPPLIGAVASATSLRVSYALIGMLGLFISLVAPRLAQSELDIP